jgi:hypothetical protein
MYLRRLLPALFLIVFALQPALAQTSAFRSKSLKSAFSKSLTVKTILSGSISPAIRLA